MAVLEMMKILDRNATRLVRRTRERKKHVGAHEIIMQCF